MTSDAASGSRLGMKERQEALGAKSVINFHSCFWRPAGTKIRQSFRVAKRMVTLVNFCSFPNTEISPQGASRAEAGAL
jgi:hypothetical protein